MLPQSRDNVSAAGMEESTALSLGEQSCCSGDYQVSASARDVEQTWIIWAHFNSHLCEHPYCFFKDF